jgi:hypothetical protein
MKTSFSSLNRDGRSTLFMSPEREIATMPFRHSSLPDDLLEWMDANDLVGLILETQAALHWKPPTAWTRQPDGSTVHSPMLLTLLTYAYARSLFSTSQIMASMVEDAMIGYLCARQIPTESTLRHFRRNHRNLIRYCLVGVFAAAWREKHTPILSTSLPRAIGLVEGAAFVAEAEHRLNLAVQIDSWECDV